MASLKDSTVAGNAVYHAGNYGRIISRGNPGSATPLSLTAIGETHYYTASGVNSMEISTTMVEDAVYELYYTCSGTNPNIDIVIQPNYTTYASQFAQFYWGSPTFYIFDQAAQPYFYFDHLAGGVGTNPSGRWILYNSRALKQVQYRGGDTQSTCMGTGRWNNTTTQWLNVGTLVGMQSGTTHVFVRRIG